MCTKKYLNDILFFVDGVEVSYLPCIEQSIHVLKEALLLDLCVCQQEHCGVAVLTSSLQQRLQEGGGGGMTSIQILVKDYKYNNADL